LSFKAISNYSLLSFRKNTSLAEFVEP